MAFQHAAAPLRTRTKEVLSADNTKPDRFTLIDTLRRAAPVLQLSPSVIATVDALLSCLPPKRDHDVVFASNATLVMRRNGISDRTLRRHLAELVTAGLLIRIDSPNGKRYSKRDPQVGSVLRFGLDLSRLFSAFGRLQTAAQEQTIVAQRTDYLRTRLRVAIRQAGATSHASAFIAEAQRALRRKLTIKELEHWLLVLDQTPEGRIAAASDTPPSTAAMSVSNGQNVRQQQKSEKELNDKVAKTDTTLTGHNAISLDNLTAACPQATELLPEKMRSPWDVVTHARRLAPMIGIDSSCYDAAEEKHGPYGTALTIWGMLEILQRVHQPGAYFRSITTGRRSSAFDPWLLIDRLLGQSRRQSRNCPRTNSVRLGTA